MLYQQRTAGNQAVSGLLSSPTVQRHKGSEPEIAAAHVVSEAEQADLPEVADTPGLVAERADLQAERKPIADRVKAAKGAADKADTERIKEIDARLIEIKTKLGLRVKGDEAVTLEHNGYTAGTAAWFADVSTITFLGKPATVHSLLAARLAKAEKALSGMSAPTGGWVSEGHSTLRKPGESLHSFGLAIDLNPGTNPFLVEPQGQPRYEPTDWSQSIRDVIERAALLVLGRSMAEEAFFTRPDDKDKDARAEASYDKISEASSAFQRYLTLADADHRKELDDLIVGLGAKNPKGRDADAWVKLIKADRKTIDRLADAKSWKHPGARVPEPRQAPGQGDDQQHRCRPHMARRLHRLSRTGRHALRHAGGRPGQKDLELLRG